MVSLAMIPLLVKKALIVFQNDLLPFLLLLSENTLFLAYLFMLLPSFQLTVVTAAAVVAWYQLKQ